MLNTGINTSHASLVMLYDRSICFLLWLGPDLDHSVMSVPAVCQCHMIWEGPHYETEYDSSASQWICSVPLLPPTEIRVVWCWWTSLKSISRAMLHHLVGLLRSNPVLWDTHQAWALYKNIVYSDKVDLNQHSRLYITLIPLFCLHNIIQLLLTQPSTVQSSPAVSFMNTQWILTV